MIDQDTDCFVTESEMTSAMRCFGYDQPDLVKAIFSCIDRDEDGKLTRKEYVAGWVNFMLGQDRNSPFVRAFAPNLLE